MKYGVTFSSNCGKDMSMKIEHFCVEDVKNILNILQIEKHFA